MSFRILLWADHRQRDLLFLAWLKLQLESLLPGSSVAVVSFDIWREAMEAFRPHLILINHLHGKRNEIIARWVRNQGGLVAVSPTEGKPVTEALLKWATGTWPHDLCDLYMPWSQVVADALPDSLNVKLTGCPRLDFYYPPLDAATAGREDVLAMLDLDPEKPVHTVASSFPAAKFADNMTEFNVSDWRDLKMTSVPGREDPTGFSQIERQYREDFLREIVSMMNRAGGQWVIKPHPAEDVKRLQGFCDMYGAKLMLNAPINDLLRISDCHVARRGCVTIAEAMCCQVPVRILADAHSAEAIDGEDIEAVLTGRMATEDYLWKWYGYRRDSTGELAYALVDLLDEKKPVVSPPDDSGWLTFWRAYAKHDAERTVPAVDQYGQFGKAVTASLVRRTVLRLQTLAGPAG